MKHVVRITLGIAIVLLGYICVMSIVTPIKFDEQREAREKDIRAKLLYIRTAQIEFKKQFGHYTADGDSLINFIENGKVSVVKKEGTLTDEQLKNGLNEAKALKIVRSGNQKEIIANGLEHFRRDTTYVCVYDNFFANDLTHEQVKQLLVVPHSNGQHFEIESTLVYNEKTGISTSVFEARAPYEMYLSDLSHQQIVNLKENNKKLAEDNPKRYNGLKIGSLSVDNNGAGNWE